jgi:3'(2'), 5'-bisphosphate nucleotidase
LTMAYESERRAAVAAVIKACRLIRTVQQTHSSHDVVDKKDHSPVTVADFGAQALINDHLKALFPGDLIVAEEDSSLLAQRENADLLEAVFTRVRPFSPHWLRHRILEAIDLGSGVAGPEGRFWVLDPIDGTKGFLRGDQYAVALALIDGGRVVLGVLGCPNLPLKGMVSGTPRGCLFAATRGEGSVMSDFHHPEGRAIHVTSAADPSLARFCESFESEHSAQQVASSVARDLGITQPPLRLDSQAKYGVVARGDASIYLRLPPEKTYREKIWDHAAGSIIVEEAGGRVTDMEGKPLDFTGGNLLIGNRGIIATNGKFHDLLVEAVKKEFSRI